MMESSKWAKNSERCQGSADARGSGPGVINEGHSSIITGRPSITVPLSSPPSLSQVNAGAAVGREYFSPHNLLVQVTRFTEEFKRMTEELQQVKRDKFKEFTEGIKLKNKFDQRNEKIRELNCKLERNYKKTDELQELMSDLMVSNLELEKMLKDEKKARIDAEENLRKVKKALKDVMEEFHQCTKAEHKRSSTATTGEAWATTSQVSLTAELNCRNMAVQKLATCLDSMRKNNEASPAQKPPPQQCSSTTRQMAQQETKSAMNLSLGTKTITSNTPRVANNCNNNSNTPKTTPIPDTQEIRRKEHAEDIERISGVFFCICGKAYRSRASLQVHILTFTAEYKFKCSKCNLEFLYYCMLKRHQIDKHQTNLEGFGCSFCGNYFPTNAGLFLHRKVAHGSKLVERKNGPSNLKRIGVGHSDTKGRFSAIGRKRDLPMPKLTNVEKDSSCMEELVTPQANPILVSNENGEAVSINGDNVNEQPSTSSVAQNAYYAKDWSKFGKPFEQHAQSSKPSVFSSSKKTAPQKQPAHGVDNSKIGHFCLCGKEYRSDSAVKAHVRYHTKKGQFSDSEWICPSYWKQQMLESHNTPPAAIKRFWCKECAKVFYTSDELVDHHTKEHETSNHVPRINRSVKTARVLAISRQRQLNAQIPPDKNSIHRPTDERGACCCGRKYFSIGALRNHIRQMEI